jgi:hypothetical protein
MVAWSNWSLKIMKQNLNYHKSKLYRALNLQQKQKHSSQII